MAGEPWYVPPVDIPLRKDETPCIQAQQGDIFQKMPAFVVRSRPLHALRPPTGSPPKAVADWLRANPSGVLHRMVQEDAQDQVRPPLDWATAGEDILAHATRGAAVLLTQDCELDKPRQRVLLTFARIRLMDRSQSADAIENMRNRNEYRAFYLAPQNDHPVLEECYVDFGSLTTIRLQCLLMEDGIHIKDRYLSMHPDVRDAMRQDFIDYMTADREVEGE